MSIHQVVTINASPSTVYNVLMSSDEFARMTGDRKADISREVGGAVSMFGGDIKGCNVELIPDKRVIQAWRSKNWPDGVYSIVHFELEPDGKGTRLTFDQAGYPDGAETMLEPGWHQMYWQPMNAMLAGR